LQNATDSLSASRIQTLEERLEKNSSEVIYCINQLKELGRKIPSKAPAPKHNTDDK